MLEEGSGSEPTFDSLSFRRTTIAPPLAETFSALFFHPEERNPNDPRREMNEKRNWRERGKRKCSLLRSFFWGIEDGTLRRRRREHRRIIFHFLHLFSAGGDVGERRPHLGIPAACRLPFQFIDNRPDEPHSSEFAPCLPACQPPTSRTANLATPLFHEHTHIVH